MALATKNVPSRPHSTFAVEHRSFDDALFTFRIALLSIVPDLQFIPCPSIPVVYQLQTVTSPQLKPAPRILRNLLARLNIECDNAPAGCTAIVKLDILPNHCVECDFNPKVSTRRVQLLSTSSLNIVHRCANVREIVT